MTTPSRARSAIVQTSTPLPTKPTDSHSIGQALAPVDILETILPVYEHAVWLADMGIVDFDPFAPLADLIARLRAERPS
jgi:hypothetical protein